MNEVQVKPQRPDAYTVQRRFNALPETYKQELSHVIAGIIQTHGRAAAQRWLEQRLTGSKAAEVSEPLQDNMLSLRAGDSERYAQLACDVEALTPSRGQLTVQAPTTVTELSPEAKVYMDAATRAEPFTQEQLALIAPALTRQSRKVMRFLHLFATTHALNRGQSLKAQQISFFLPAEIISLVTNVPTRTVYDAIGRLKALGIVDQRGHVTTLEGRGNRCDGTIFAVKLDVLKEGEARVAFDDLAVPDYRDLAADIDAGRTVYLLAQSTWVGNLHFSVCVLLSWLESKCTHPWTIQVVKPRFMTVQAGSGTGLEAVLGVTTGAVANRGHRIGAGAAAIARAFGDHHSLAFWWKFCDALACLVERGGRDYAPAMMAAMQREVAAKHEGFARCPAALFIARLKRSGVYGEIMTA